MKKRFILFLFMGVWRLAFAQPTIQWQKTFGGSNFDEPMADDETIYFGKLEVIK